PVRPWRKTVASRAGVLCQSRRRIAGTSLGEDFGAHLAACLSLAKVYTYSIFINADFAVFC
ncbi:MAG: hypothetical protein WCI20_15015, partial [bacterium]